MLALASLCQSGSGRKRRSKAFKFYQIRIFIRRLLLIYNHQASRSFLIPFLSRLFSTPANFKPSQLFSQLFSRLFFLFFLRFFLTLSRESVRILLCFVRIDKYFINSYEEKATMGKKAIRNSANHWQRIIPSRSFSLHSQCVFRFNGTSVLCCTRWKNFWPTILIGYQLSNTMRERVTQEKKAEADI